MSADADGRSPLWPLMPGLVRDPAAWPLLVLPLACMVALAAHLADRQHHVLMAHLLLMVLPLVWWLAARRTCLADPWSQRVLLGAWLYVVYLAIVQLGRGDVPDVGWWRLIERAAALAGCVAVAAGGVNPATALRVGGAAAAITLLISTGASWGVAPRHRGPPEAYLGMGAVHVLGQTVGPALIAWGVWLAVTCWRQRCWSRDWLLLAPALGVLATLMIVGERRGLALAVFAVLGWLALCRLWAWNRYAATAVGGLAFVILVGVGSWVLFGSRLGSSDIRLYCYRAAWETGLRGLPWGFGSYGCMHLADGVGENARHLTALGWFLQAHNDFLDAWLDGGIPGLVLALALTALVAWRVFMIADPALRLALQCLGLAILVHASTDNCYALPLGQAWCAIAVGIMLAAPSRLPRARIWPWLAQPRWWLLVLAMISAVGVVNLAPVPWIRHGAPAVEHARIVTRCWDPAAINAHAVVAFNGVLAGERIDPQPLLRALADRFRADDLFMSIQLTLSWRAPPAQRLGILLHAQRRYPLVTGVYQQIGACLAAEPALADRVPMEIVRRIAYFQGRRDLPAPDLSGAPEDIEQAADQLAGLTWALARGAEWSALVGPTRRLLLRYGDLPDVAQFAVLVASNAPDGAFADLADHRRILHRGLESSERTNAVLAEATTPEQARRLMPLLARLYPKWIAMAERGRVDTDERMTRSEVLRCWQVLRIWCLSRRPSSTPR